MIRRLSISTLTAILLLTVAALAPVLADVNHVFNTLDTPGKEGNSYVRVITENVEAWYARWYIISNAKQTIDTTYFIVENDVFGKSFVGLLLKKAKEGVQIRLMVDARGTKGLARTFLGQDYLQELMQQKGVAIKVYNPIHKALLAIPQDIRTPIASNHDKLVICDGQWVITGGRNISKNYFAAWKDLPKAYRDTDIIIHGVNIATAARQAFELEFNYLPNTEINKDWFNFDSRNVELELARRAMEQHLLGNGLTDPSKLTDHGDLLKELNTELAQYPGLVGFAAYKPFGGERMYPTKLLDKSSLTGDKNEITPAIIRFFDAAQKKIVIQNPYVVLTGQAREALQRAAARGVPIYLLTNSPDSSDSLLTQAMFVKDWKNILKSMPTMRIFAYRGPAKVHAKVMSIDDQITIIGTYNMDPMSEQINSECVAVVTSTAFGTQNRLRIENDAKNAVEYKIRLGANGEPEQVVGPSDHVKASALDAVNKAQLLSFLRPII